MLGEYGHFIGGKMTSPTGVERLQATRPADGEKVALVPLGSAQDVDEAVASASQALSNWRKRRPIERGRILLDIAAKVRLHKGELAKIECSETGKPAWLAPHEIEGAAQYFEYYGGLVNLFHGESIDLGDDYHSYTVREPYGVVGIIVPWNAPLNQAARGIAPALAAGNTVVAKPSEFTSGSLLELARMAAEECGLPPGVLNVVLGTGKSVGERLVAHPDVRKVAFTGSQRAGIEVGRIAAEKIMPLTLELGGKSANIIFADADLSQAVPGAVRAFTLNAGQICVAGSRLLVERPVYESVLQGLRAAAPKLTVGPETGAIIGPITTEDQYRKVLAFFDLAASEGAELIAGGQAVAEAQWGEGRFIAPTIYAGVSNEMRIAREEIFGPVLVVIPFDDEAEAIRIANDTEYGLAAGIWTKDLSRAHRVASALQAGQIYVNEYQAGGVETPLGGYKKSGHGREKGIEALHHYTQLKCVTIKL